MAKRNNVIKFRLTNEELEVLNAKVLSTGLSRERYIRNVLSGVKIKEKPDIEYHKLINELNHIGNNLNQLTRNSYLGVIGIEANEILNLLKSIIQNLDKTVRGNA